MRISAVLLTAVALVLTCGASTTPAAPAGCICPQGVSQTGQTTLLRAHDPVVAKEGKRYYLFTTGRGILVNSSTDLLHWRHEQPVFSTVPSWNTDITPYPRDYFWAPDISKFHGRWRLYYALSMFGKNRSVIGLATNSALDPKRADYAWKDEGKVIESFPTDDWNAIDPNAVVDEEGRPWLAFGSYWSGIKLARLDPETGKPSAARPELISIAARPRTPPIHGAVEAPFIYRHGRYFYLFVSFDQCCRGADSTYNLRIGRAAKITGPYVDRDGKAMMDGGGTLLHGRTERWRGPGHNAVLKEGKTDWLFYHAYDAEDRGIPRLRIEKLDWNKDDWPVPQTSLDPMSSESYTSPKPAYLP